MTRLLLIFVGSGLGGVLRHLLTLGVQKWTGTPFPFGTLAVNILGCLTIGFLGALFAGSAGAAVKEDLRVAIFVGVIGGFTTFSAFGKETIALADDRQLLLAGANVIASVVLGLGAVWVGLRAGERAFGAGV